MQVQCIFCISKLTIGCFNDHMPFISPRRKMAKVAAERLLEMVANPAKRTPRKDVVETIIHEQHSIAQL